MSKNFFISNKDIQKVMDKKWNMHIRNSYIQNTQPNKTTKKPEGIAYYHFEVNILLNIGQTWSITADEIHIIMIIVSYFQT